jgi:DNA-directed RNA polymerase subunit RPC12/RpoP
MASSPFDWSSWRPPDNYALVPSALDGITVYAPVKPEQRDQAPATYHCPKCGAVTRYQVAAGGVACQHCGFIVPVEARTVGQAARDFEFTVDTLAKAEQGWGQGKMELHCDACGADMVIAKKELAVTCPFCTSNRVNIRPAPSDQLQPLFLIPFQIQPQTNTERARQWLGAGWFHPAELSSDTLISHFSGIYLPFFTFDAVITGHGGRHRLVMSARRATMMRLLKNGAPVLSSIGAGKADRWQWMWMICCCRAARMSAA